MANIDGINAQLLVDCFLFGMKGFPFHNVDGTNHLSTLVLIWPHYLASHGLPGWLKHVWYNRIYPFLPKKNKSFLVNKIKICQTHQTDNSQSNWFHVTGELNYPVLRFVSSMTTMILSKLVLGDPPSHLHVRPVSPLGRYFNVWLASFAVFLLTPNLHERSIKPCDMASISGL